MSQGRESEPTFHDVLQATSGLPLELPAEPSPHARRLLDMLAVDWSVVEGAPEPCRCKPHDPRYDRRGQGRGCRFEARPADPAHPQNQGAFCVVHGRFDCRG